MMRKIIATQETWSLYHALKKRGVYCEVDYNDNEYKHVDLRIKNTKIFIEIDGLQHSLDPDQIISDINRDHFSDDEGFRTIRITNATIRKNLDTVADAIAEVVRKRYRIRH